MGFGLLTAQRVIKKSVFDPTASIITIDAENCFKVELSTSETKEIVVQAHIDGEYKNELVLHVVHHGPSVEISTDFQPYFVQPNDKLSAHKVLSISLEVQIPENMDVGIIGTSTNVFVHGEYAHLRVLLDDGSCNLSAIYGTMKITTRSGDINVYTKGATFLIKNSFGIVEREPIPEADVFFDLTTTMGDVHLIKTE